jgi:putative inorganic carbon (hco3(-)) transporter
MIYAVALTASRGGAIAFLAAALVCLWHLGIQRRKLYLLLFIPAAVALLWLSNSNGLRERFEQTAVAPETAQGTEASGSALQRQELFVQSLRVSAQHPLFGVGPGNFEIVSGVWHVTHNSYTQMSAEGGILAFLLYVLIMSRGFSNLRYIRRHRGSGKNLQTFSMALAASLVAYLVGSFFSTDGYQMFPYCLIAYSGSLRAIVQEQTPQVNPAPAPAVSPLPETAEVVAWN